MPELPEVEVVRCGLEPHAVGRTITDFYYSGLAMRLPLDTDQLHNLVVGQKIISINRRAKYLLIELENNALLVVHLGMSGKLGIFPAETTRRKHDHFCLQLDNGNEIRLNDARRFGSVQIFATGDAGRKSLFGSIGPEPFADLFSPSYLFDRAKNKKQPVKNFLMDSRVVAGIGNIYASEILFVAGILPHKQSGKLSKKQWQKVIEATHVVLKKAIACGGTTIADFENSNGERGYFQLELNVYGRENEPCATCGYHIVRAVMAGRSTYFCTKCQK